MLGAAHMGEAHWQGTERASSKWPPAQQPSELSPANIHSVKAKPSSAEPSGEVTAPAVNTTADLCKA